VRGGVSGHVVANDGVAAGGAKHGQTVADGVKGQSVLLPGNFIRITLMLQCDFLFTCNSHRQGAILSAMDLAAVLHFISIENKLTCMHSTWFSNISYACVVKGNLHDGSDFLYKKQFQIAYFLLYIYVVNNLFCSTSF
jgi:hypothetical protein